MNKQPLVSIITVCYNSSLTIENTIKSVLDQTYNNIEYIIVDGNSTDSTLDIVKSYQKRFDQAGKKYIWISEKDNGIYDAMNKGIRMSNGELIGIINSDDNYELEAVASIVEAFENDDSYDVYHGLVKYFNSNKLHMIRGCSSDNLKKHMIEHPACFVKKSTYEEIGVFDCKYKYVADYDFLSKLKVNNRKFILIDKVIASFYDGGAGSCSQARFEALEVRRKYRFINQFKYTLKKIDLSIRNITAKR